MVSRNNANYGLQILSLLSGIQVCDIAFENTIYFDEN